MLQSEYEKIKAYYEAYAQIPLTVAPNISFISIIGENNGFLARECLKFKDVKLINQVVPDNQDAFRMQQAMRDTLYLQLTNNSLWDDRVIIYQQRPSFFLKQHKNEHGLIFIDLYKEENCISKIKKLLPQIKESLIPEGLAIIQINALPHIVADLVWDISKIWNYVSSINAKEKDSYFTFILGSNEPLIKRRLIQGAMKITDKEIENWLQGKEQQKQEFLSDISTAYEGMSIDQLQKEIENLKNDLIVIDSGMKALDQIAAKVKAQNR
jgi:spermidine synthase